MKKVICIFLILSIYVFSKEIYIVSGAGYKLPVLEISKKYEKETGIKTNCIFGNMKQITTYVKKTDKVSLIIGDSNFIKKSKIKIKKTKNLGYGKLILVFKKSLKIKDVSDLIGESIVRIGIPDPQKAIYGKASVESLKYFHIYNDLKSKLLILKTVPQVTSYLKTGEIDAGLINITDFKGIRNNNLNKLELNEKSYNQIIIEAGLITNESIDFYEYLSKKESQDIFKKYGL